MMKTTLAGLAALALLVGAHGVAPSALAQTAPTGTGVRGGVNGQGPTGFTENPGTGTRGSATRRASRQERRQEQRQTTARPRPTDPRDRAYMDGGMVGGTTGSDPMPGHGAGGMTGGSGTGSHMGMPGMGSHTGMPGMGMPGTGPGATGGVGSGNQPGTGGTSTGR